MNRFIAWSLFVLGTLFIAGCGDTFKGGGSPPEAPTNVKVVAGDSGVIISWDMQSGIEYWIFSAAAPSISTDTWTTLPQARVIRGAISPQIVAGLINGTTYSFTVNGRQEQGPGGPGSPSIAAIPRLAGQLWVIGTPLDTASLNAVTFVGTTVPGVYTTVGAGGKIFNSQDGVSWTSVVSGITTDLNGIAYGFGRYHAVGTGGAMLVSLDGTTWATQASGTTADLRSAAGGSQGIVAVGRNGTIVRSPDGGNFSPQVSGTTKDLYSVTYAVNNLFYAAGAEGTLLSSPDGVTWTAIPTGTTADLRGFAFNGITYIAVGTGGTIIYSADSVTWTAAAPPTTVTLNAVTAASQYVAVGAGGVILTSVDGANWSPVGSPTPNDLNAIVYGAAGYSAVGTGGVNISSF